jgi:hypothetical protein
MNLNSVSAFLGLRANASPTSTNVTNDVQIGVSAQQIAFPTASAAYSVRMFIADGSTVDLDLLTNDTTGSDAWVAGVAQVETATAVGTITGTGNATVVFTGPVVGSPITLSVPVVNGDTAAVWAEKVRVALAANGPISDNYTIGGASTSIIITRKPWEEVSGVPFYLTNNSGLNISLDNGTCTGITTAATSANTTLGVATSGALILDGDEDVFGEPISGATVAAMLISCGAGSCVVSNETDTYELGQGLQRLIIGGGASSAFLGSSDFTFQSIDNAVEITLTVILL